MIRLYLTENVHVYEKTINILNDLGCKNVLLDFTEPKPKISQTTPCSYYFNISHSKNLAVIAVSTFEVGVDLELFSGKYRRAVISRFCEKEREEIKTEADFLKHWTAREAFIKMNGKTLAEYFKRLQFYGGKMYLNGECQSCKIGFAEIEGGIVAVCGQSSQFILSKY